MGLLCNGRARQLYRFPAREFPRFCERPGLTQEGMVDEHTLEHEEEHDRQKGAHG